MSLDSHCDKDQADGFGARVKWEMVEGKSNEEKSKFEKLFKSAGARCNIHVRNAPALLSLGFVYCTCNATRASWEVAKAIPHSLTPDGHLSACRCQPLPIE